MNEHFPNFDEAVAQVRDWLTGNKLPAEIGWVFCEDVTWHRKQFYVRLPLPADNASLACAWYDTGRQIADSLRVDVNCHSTEISFCSVWFPEDSCDAAHWPHKGFRIQQHPAFGRARCTRSKLAWRLTSAWSSLSGNVGPLCDIPYRKYASNQTLHATAAAPDS